MKYKKQINIYLVDNDNSELEYFRDNFSLGIDYKLYTFSSVEMFLNKLKSHIKEKKIKIVIIDYLVKSRGLGITTAAELLPRIKSLNKDIEVIIIADSDNIELKATGSNIKPTAYIRKDSQNFVRLEAILNRIISQHVMNKKVKDIKKGIILLLALTIIGFFLFFINLIL